MTVHGLVRRQGSEAGDAEADHFLGAGADRRWAAAPYESVRVVPVRDRQRQPWQRVEDRDGIFKVRVLSMELPRDVVPDGPVRRYVPHLRADDRVPDELQQLDLEHVQRSRQDPAEREAGVDRVSCGLHELSTRHPMRSRSRKLRRGPDSFRSSSIRRHRAASTPIRQPLFLFGLPTVCRNGVGRVAPPA